MSSIRIAVCQLRSHPALYTGHISYPEEPFVPFPSDPSLSRLGTKGIAVDSLHEYCLTEYTNWAATRLTAILSHLSSFNPVPDVVIFPECGILISSLPVISAWSKKNAATVLAGTHTPLSTASARQAYSAVGIGSGHVDRIARTGTTSVLPLISAGKTKLIRKKGLAPTEFSSVDGQRRSRPSIKAYPIQTSIGELQLAPIICAEALLQPNLPRNFNIAAIVSYDSRPEQFDSFISETVRNRHMVIYCNDGRFGGSNVFASEDVRMPNWFGDAMPQGLPPGDSLLIFDVDPSVATVEVGTAQPERALHLVCAQSILFSASEALLHAETMLSIRKIENSDARAVELRSLRGAAGLNPLQQHRVEHLHKQERQGVNTERWWEVIGDDCACHEVISLDELEAQLAARCRDAMMDVLPSASSPAATAQDLIGFLSLCQSRTALTRTSERPTRSDNVTVFDRDNEARTICEFLDDRTRFVMEVTGLPQIGKTLAIEKALSQHGNAKSLFIPLTNTSSTDYILYALLKSITSPQRPPYEDPLKMLDGPQVDSALQGIDVLCLQNSHTLSDHGIWRDKLVPELLGKLIDRAEECGTKVLIEGQRPLTMDLGDHRQQARLRVYGLPEDHAAPYLNSRLRAVGLPIDVLVDSDRKTLIKKLGGHPVILTIAADVMFEDGAEVVLKNVKKRSGFFLNFLNTLIRQLQLTDEEHEILRLACLARAEIPREAIAETVQFAAARHTRNLLNMGALENGRYGHLRLSALLREYFDPRELPPEQQDRFHAAAAKALQRYAAEYDDLSFAVEAEYHAGFSTDEFDASTALIDGALATASTLFEQQKYARAAKIIDGLLSRKRSHDVVRLGAMVHAKLNDFDKALELTREAFTQDRHDTWLLSELARTALTQSRADVAEELVGTARSAGVEDVSILVVEGRMHLRRHELDKAEEVFSRARQLTVHNPWPFFFLGRTYMTMGRLDEAIDVLFEGEQFTLDSERRNRNVLNAIRTQLGISYLYMDRADLAGPIIDGLFEDNPNSPEVIRVYAALTIKRNGIEQAHKALKELGKAKIRNRHDRCQFHLLYGLFSLGIGDKDGAAREFDRAHHADRTNVFVMIKHAETLFDLAVTLWIDGNAAYKDYVRDCKSLVSQILKFDVDNDKGLTLVHELHRQFNVRFD